MLNIRSTYSAVIVVYCLKIIKPALSQGFLTSPLVIPLNSFWLNVYAFLIEFKEFCDAIDITIIIVLLAIVRAGYVVK